MENQKRAFDPESTSVARLKKRRDYLRERGEKSGVVGKLSRLINKMERGWSGAVVSEQWSPKPDEMPASIVKKIRQPKEKPTGKFKASQRAQMRPR